VEVTVVAPRVHREDPLEEERAGLPVRRFSYPSGGKRLKEMGKPSARVLGAYLASALAALIRESRRNRPDWILCHWVLPTGPVAAALSAMLGVPLSIVAHGSDVNVYSRSSRAAAALARLALKKADLVLAVSPDLREALVERLGVPQTRTELLPMGVDDEIFAGSGAGEADALREEARRRLGLDPAVPAVLFVGDLIPQKGVLEILEAQKELSRRGTSLMLYLVGEGPLRGASRPGVTFTGRLPQKEILFWYRAADIFVLPSHSEGSPVTVMEALRSGLPVVASRVGGIPDLVEDGLTGFLVPAKDPRALSHALDGLLRNPDALKSARQRLLSDPPDVLASSRARRLRQLLEEKHPKI
jgi:glycosyltransferase involved in cell wall biosynthesis